MKVRIIFTVVCFTSKLNSCLARELVAECLRVCFYRDCRTINNITFAKAVQYEASIEEAIQLTEKWDYTLFKDVNANTLN